MARSKPSASEMEPETSRHPGHASSHAHGQAQQGASNGSALASLDWLQNAMSGTQRTVDTMLQLQQQWIQNATQGSETLAEEIKELQQAKDPAELLAAQVALANQQMEMLSSQFSSLLQQIYDAQLLWLGQWDEKSESAEPNPSQAAQSNAVLSAWGKAQDDWLKMTRSWIDSVNHSGISH